MIRSSILARGPGLAFLFPWALSLSFVSSLSIAQDKIIAEGDDWAYFKGTEEPPADWNTTDFNDASWMVGATPAGYSTDLPYKTVFNDMINTYWSVYFRKTFDLASADAVNGLKLSMKFDDGYVAYLNGVEIFRESMPAGAPTFETAATDHETNTTFTSKVFSCGAIELDALRTGKNVLAIQVHNATLASSDLSFSCELETITSVCPFEFTSEFRDTNGTILLRWKKTAGVTFEDLKLFRNGEQITPGPNKLSTSYTDRTPVPGLNNYRLVATVCGAECPELTTSASTTSAGPVFRRGDADDNGNVNLTDAIRILDGLFRGKGLPACPDTADVDDNNQVNLTDAIYLLNSLFRGGPQPPDPGREACGEDPTPSGLGDCVYASACQ